MSKSRLKREAEIRKVLSELAKSGDTVQAFARRRGMSAWTLYDWRRRFGSARRKARQAEFVAVEVDDRPSSSTPFEIKVGDVVVRVPANFNDADLVRLVRALGSAC